MPERVERWSGLWREQRGILFARLCADRQCMQMGGDSKQQHNNQIHGEV
jgi:hypothetical protein